MTVIAEAPGLAEQLLRDHVDDGTGRCACALDPRRRPPLDQCGPRGLAQLAVDLDDTAP